MRKEESETHLWSLALDSFPVLRFLRQSTSSTTGLVEESRRVGSGGL